MKSNFLSAIVAFFLLALPGTSLAAGVDSQCRAKGIPLYGKVQVVSAFPDLTVQVVNSFPDLKVQQVNAFPDQCGKWQFVETFPDIKVKFVEAFPDIKIQFVDAFPGQP